MRFNINFQTILKGLVTLSSLVFLNLPLNAMAANGNDSQNIELIKQYTYGALQKLDTLPAMLNQLGKMALSWLDTDNSDRTKNLQGQFSNVGNLYIADLSAQQNLQTQTDQLLLTGVTSKNLATANDLVYSTLLGMPFLKPDPRNAVSSTPIDASYNYFKNIAGLNIIHTRPSAWTTGNAEDQRKYINYYSTVTAITSYNGYVLSQLYADAKSNNAMTRTQAELVQNASSSNWQAEISGESLGRVLRQMLLYQSQTYVLLAQLIQTQKQLLLTNAMTNSLLILNNKTNEDHLLSQAMGTQPRP